MKGKKEVILQLLLRYSIYWYSSETAPEADRHKHSEIAYLGKKSFFHQCCLLQRSSIPKNKTCFNKACLNPKNQNRKTVIVFSFCCLSDITSMKVLPGLLDIVGTWFSCAEWQLVDQLLLHFLKKHQKGAGYYRHVVIDFVAEVHGWSRSLACADTANTPRGFVGHAQCRGWATSATKQPQGWTTTAGRSFKLNLN